MKVKATDKYEKLGLHDAIAHRTYYEGEVFDISEERFDLLSNPNNNKYHEIFVVKVEENVEEEKPVAKKRGRKAKK